MAVPADPAPELREHVHPERLVTTKWLAEHPDDEGLVIIESNEDVPLYGTGHIRGAVKVHWYLESNSQVIRDCIGADKFVVLCSAKGIRHDDKLVRNYDGSWAEWGNLVRALVAPGKRAKRPQSMGERIYAQHAYAPCRHRSASGRAGRHQCPRWRSSSSSFRAIARR